MLIWANAWIVEPNFVAAQSMVVFTNSLFGNARKFYLLVAYQIRCAKRSRPTIKPIHMAYKPKKRTGRGTGSITEPGEDPFTFSGDRRVRLFASD